MRNKFLLLFVVTIIAVLVTPTPAYAYSGVSGEVVTNNGDPWLYGGTVIIINRRNNQPIGGGPLATGVSTFTFSYTVPPSDGDLIEVYVIPDNGPEGAPDPAWARFTEDSNESGLKTDVIVTLNAGPNAINLVDFSVTPQANGNTWLPFALLVGSVALVSGAVTIIRKKRI